MILGNTGGKNKGKKYLKIKGDEIITLENQQKADSFKEWFGSMYKTLQIELINKDTYDEDILNDTFLRLYDKIIYGGLVIADYKAYFHRAFFTNFTQAVIKNSKLSEVMITIDVLNDPIGATEDEAEVVMAKIKLTNDIFDYVQSKYTQSEFDIFKMYITAKPAMNYIKLSAITSIPVKKIQMIISSILKDIKGKIEFIKRRKFIP